MAWSGGSFREDNRIFCKPLKNLSPNFPDVFKASVLLSFGLSCAHHQVWWVQNLHVALFLTRPNNFHIKKLFLDLMFSQKSHLHPISLKLYQGTLSKTLSCALNVLRLACGDGYHKRGSRTCDFWFEQLKYHSQPKSVAQKADYKNSHENRPYHSVHPFSSQHSILHTTYTLLLSICFHLYFAFFVGPVNPRIQLEF